MKLARADIGSLLHICRNLRAADAEEIFAQRWTDDPDELAIEAATRWGSFSWVAGVDEEPIAAIGATPLWPGVWAAWMMGTDRFPEVGKQLTRWAARVMIPAVVDAGCHRAEARTLNSHHQAHAWMETLGAKRESVLRRHGRDQQDFYLYVWEF
jgi:RimJ/RimL family protein N-acetyltransferase